MEMDELEQLDHIHMLEELIFMANCFLVSKGLNDEFKQFLKEMEAEDE